MFISWKQKMKKTTVALSHRSKVYFGDNFKQLSNSEEIVRMKEELFEVAPTADNGRILHQAHAELKNYVHFEEEEYWRQKASIE